MRLALKLLYQFRVMIDGSPGVFRRCEERYIVLEDVEDVFLAIDEFYANKDSENHSYIRSY